MGLEKTLESPLDCKEIQSVHPKGNQSWIFIGRTDVEAETPILWPPDNEELTHWKGPRCWERLKLGGEGDNRGWDGWMASPTQWTWVSVSSGSWWWTERPSMLQSMGVAKNQTQLSDWTELNHLLQVRMASSKYLQIINARGAVEKREPSNLPIYQCKLVQLLGEQYGRSLKY